jgi:NAD(P)H-dependent flavin oxidoreductase YrpB (nitropropane dioxygenase family)
MLERDLDRQTTPRGAIAGELGVGDDRLVSALHTRLCRELGIDYPIWSAGFGGAGPELVAAVSGAGGLGVLGANGGEVHIKDLPGLVDRSVHVPPSPGDFHIGLVHEPATAHSVPARAGGLGQQRREPLPQG